MRPGFLAKGWLHHPHRGIPIASSTGQEAIPVPKRRFFYKTSLTSLLFYDFLLLRKEYLVAWQKSSFAG
jgi:hypothetical protein